MTAKPPTIVFRFDASPEIGAGHAMRSGALAGALAEAGWRTICATRKETIKTVPETLAPFDDILRLNADESREVDEIDGCISGRCEAVVVDHYGRGRGFDEACRRIAPCVTVIEDRPEVAHDCDIFINPGIIAEGEISALGDRLLGPQYALLRPMFAEARTQVGRNRDNGSLVLLCGYADSQNLTERLIEALDGVPGVRTIVVVLGSANPHRERIRRRLHRVSISSHLHVKPRLLTTLMGSASVAVTAAGSTCWELACLGVPMVTVVTADNQIALERILRDAGASASAGAVDDTLGVRLRETVTALMADHVGRRRMASRGQALVDGLGATRVAQKIQSHALSPRRSIA
ncbi:MAG: UDP-2,4-diacetamido-2,4,6-trideoxy-beta-L-altropyranose hydrolase [Rhodospirillaceae bacterium]|nr:UDP-2,4-diacetamido-2,4,6-trideoxy-beta-L-altropyranose hydrolase [Rhodospirillaceae bacterium]